MSGTLSVDQGDEPISIEGIPSLVRVLRCDQPLVKPVRIPLDDIVEVALGRGEDGVTRDARRADVRVSDDRMSSAHATLKKTDRKFTLTDSGSKNGTYVNGRRVQSRELVDGDVIEAGHTFFVYRARVPLGLDPSPAWFAESTTGELPLTTFLPSLARQYQAVARVAISPIPVVVLGETGTGKEVVARAVHRMSRRSGPFVALNCGAMPVNLIESELFGAKRGAFSGAIEDRPGLVRAADGGTLFLDEVGELPASAQVALLRVLQEQEVLPIGATKPIKVDVRIIAATHRSLEHMVDADQFRSDLFARLGGLTVRLPPLRERREDLGLIIGGLIARVSPHPESTRFALPAARALFSYPFPRNVRELEKTLGLAVAIATDGMIELDSLPEDVRAPSELRPAVVVPSNEDDERRAHIIALLTQHNGRIADVARAMGKARMQIHRWIQRYDIDVEAFRK